MDAKKITVYCDRVMVFALCAMAYFLPISIALIESFFGIALISFFVKKGTNYSLKLKDVSKLSFLGHIKLFLSSVKPAYSFLSKPIAVFIFIGFLSTITSQYPLVSLKAFFFKMLQDTFTYFIFVEAVSNQKRLKIIIVFLLISAALIATSGFFQLVSGTGFIHGHTLTVGLGINSSFSHPNDFGGYLTILTLLSLSLLMFSDHRVSQLSNFFRNNQFKDCQISLVFIVLTIALMACLGLTYSRGSWIAFFLGLIFFAFVKRRFFYVPLVIIILFSSVFFPLMKHVKLTPIFFEHGTLTVPIELSFDYKQFKNKLGKDIAPDEYEQLKSKFGKDIAPDDYEQLKSELGKDIAAGRDYSGESARLLELLKIYEARNERSLFERITASGRQLFWKESLTIIKDYPILGTGLNTYTEVASRYNFTWGAYPHNSYLHMAAEMGILGLLAFLWVILRLFYKTLLNLSKINDITLSCILTGLTCGVFGFLAHCLVDTNLYSVQLVTLLWLSIGMMVTCQKLSLSET